MPLLSIAKTFRITQNKEQGCYRPKGWWGRGRLVTRFAANVDFEISGERKGYKRYIINGLSKENRICCMNKGEGEIGAERWREHPKWVVRKSKVALLLLHQWPCLPFFPGLYKSRPFHYNWELPTFHVPHSLTPFPEQSSNPLGSPPNALHVSTSLLTCLGAHGSPSPQLLEEPQHWFICSSSIQPALEHGWGLPPQQAHWSHFTFITTTTRTPLILPSNPNFLVHYILPSSETYFLCSHFPLIFCLLWADVLLQVQWDKIHIAYNSPM